MTPFGSVLLAVYALASFVLFVYGLNAYVMLGLYFRHRTAARSERRERSIEFWRTHGDDALPLVTTQLPIYNERFVAERLLSAAAAVDYPRERHEIQVLDDSTDETELIIAREVERLRAAGHRIEQIRRTDRCGFKAGALAHGLQSARGEFIAVFDADFIPPRDFLRRTVPFLLLDPTVAMVQTRWGHVNQSYSLLTAAQAVGIDGHFVVEQSARTWHGLFMNFNGTAGIWRRAAIDDAGGWQADTLTEDLDLSYRAQLRGWRMEYLGDVVAPSELPIDINGLKSQQHRWAKGSIQVARKLLPQVFRSNRSWLAKTEALLHLTHYLIHPLILIVALLAWPALTVLSRLRASEYVFYATGAFLVVSALSPSILYFQSQRVTYPDWRSRVLVLPALVALGIGIAVNNSRAVIEGLFGRGGDFVRTPKYGVIDARPGALSPRRTYRVGVGFGPVLELLLAAYGIVTLALYAREERWAALPLLALNAIGFAAVGLLSVVHAWRARPLRSRRPAG